MLEKTGPLAVVGATPPARILFVDDDPGVLHALQVRFRRLRQKWEMSFAESGSEALALCTGRTPDVVVTDLGMPHMDGVALLHRVKDQYPAAVRIILSGDAGPAARAVAHHCLGKPCGAERLRCVVDRAFALQLRLRAPVPSPIERAFAALRGDSRFEPSGGDLIARALQLLAAVQAPLDVPDERWRDFVRHATLSGRLARDLAAGSDQIDEAYAAGLVHRLGQLLRERAGHADVAEGGRPSDADVAVWLLTAYGIPFAVAEAVAFHGEPERMEPARIDLVASTALASALADRHLVGGSVPDDLLDAMLRERTAAGLTHWLGVAARLDDTRAGVH